MNIWINRWTNFCSESFKSIYISRVDTFLAYWIQGFGSDDFSGLDELKVPAL